VIIEQRLLTVPDRGGWQQTVETWFAGFSTVELVGIAGSRSVGSDRLVEVMVRVDQSWTSPPDGYIM
jgi:hypothetical protein